MSIKIGPKYPISFFNMHILIKLLISMIAVLIFYHDTKLDYYPYDI